MPSPMGIMETSVPKEKKAMPKISITVPTKNRAKVSSGMGTTATLNASMRKVMGSTAASDSRIFSFKILFTANLLL